MAVLDIREEGGGGGGGEEGGGVMAVELIKDPDTSPNTNCYGYCNSSPSTTNT